MPRKDMEEWGPKEKFDCMKTELEDIFKIYWKPYAL